ncbi:hypothetical protein G6717_06095 [Polynucleobacter paneuropaeus]|nr:hypothetical protein [Polynucleobacter paneuropaeus]
MAIVGKQYIRLYFLSVLLLGIAYISFLPPFEGFDENAHFSRVREISATKQITPMTKSFIDQAVVGYAGPMPYGSGEPPFNKGLVYPTFFASNTQVNLFIEQSKSFTTPFSQSNQLNWQAQHPPLYYLLLSPIASLISSLSLIWQIFILRFLSFFLAFSGLLLTWFASERIEDIGKRNVLKLGLLFYPALVPMFFLEFCRIGNDSLCLLLTGAVTFALANWFKYGANKKYSLLVGLLLGLGLLTKAFFLPISVGLVSFLGFRALRQDAQTRLGQLQGVFLIALCCMLIGGSWYLYSYLSFNDLGLGSETGRIFSISAFLQSFREHVTFSGLTRSLLAPLFTFGWAGTWSLARLSPWLQLPLACIEFFLALLYFIELRNRPITDLAYLPLWLFSLFYFGLVWHVLVGIALDGIGASGGWYLNILLPWFALVFGMGLERIFKFKNSKLLVLSGLAFLFLFQLVAAWDNSALFAGCAIKGEDKFLQFTEPYMCIAQWRLIYDRLALLTHPNLTIVTWCMGWVIYGLTLLSQVRISIVKSNSAP